MDSIQWEKDEVLTLTATDTPILLEAIWVNVNHDPNSGEFDAWEWMIAGESYSGADLSPDDLDAVNGGDYRIDLGIVLALNDPITIFTVGGPDSYISAIAVSPIPLPAAGFLLLGGLGGLAAMKRRKKA